MKVAVENTSMPRKARPPVRPASRPRPAPIERRDENGGENDLAAATAAVETLRFSVEQNQRTVSERLTTELRGITERISGIETRINRPTVITSPQNTDEAAELQKRAFDNFIRYGVERMKPEETRALVVSTTTAGGFLVPDDFQKEIVKNLVLSSPMRQIARISQASGTTILLPKRTGELAAAWVPENTDNSTTQPTYGQQVITVYEASCAVEVSNALLEDAAFDLASDLALDFAEEFGRLEGMAFVNGTGNGQPEGFVNDADFLYETADAAALTAEDLIDVFHAVPTLYANRGTWVMNRNTMGACRKLKTSNGAYIWQESLAAGNPPTILGRPVVEFPDMSNQTAGSPTDHIPLAFGDWSSAFRVFDRVGLSILRDPYSQARKSLTVFHARRRVGGALVKPEAVRGLRMPG